MESLREIIRDADQISARLCEKIGELLESPTRATKAMLKTLVQRLELGEMSLKIRLPVLTESGSHSLRGIAVELNERLVPTKNNGVWQANTVRKILSRC